MTFNGQYDIRPCFRHGPALPKGTDPSTDGSATRRAKRNCHHGVSAAGRTVPSRRAPWLWPLVSFAVLVLVFAGVSVRLGDGREHVGGVFAQGLGDAAFGDGVLAVDALGVDAE